MKLSWEGEEQRKETKGRRKRKGNRSLLGRWPGGECSHSAARPGGRSRCWPAPGGAAQFSLPPQPAGREPVTMLCCPLSSRAWPDSLRTALCSAPALEGGRQQRPLISPGKGTSQLALHDMSQPCCPCICSNCGLWNPVTCTTANCIQKGRACSLVTRAGEAPAVLSFKVRPPWKQQLQYSWRARGQLIQTGQRNDSDF